MYNYYVQHGLLNFVLFQDLIIGSSVLLLDDVLEVCVDYIKTRIDSDNCLELNEMANSIPLKELHSYCMNFIVKNFQ